MFVLRRAVSSRCTPADVVAMYECDVGFQVWVALKFALRFCTWPLCDVTVPGNPSLGSK